jgi:hypothetical protein
MVPKVMRALGGGSNSDTIMSEIEEGQGDEADGEMDLMEFINYILRSSFDHDPKSAMYNDGTRSRTGSMVSEASSTHAPYARQSAR